MLYLAVSQAHFFRISIYLRRFCESLHGGGLRGVELGGGDLDALLQRLREHGGADALRTGLVQLLVHV